MIILALALVLLVVGSLGVLGATFLPGWLAGSLNQSNCAASPTGTMPSLEVLITAHNEEQTIAGTLASVAAALPADTSAIVVGLDRCTDRTREVAEMFAATAPLPVRCQEKQGRPGKWRLLVELAHAGRAEWVAFVDCGSRWDPMLVRDSLPAMCREKVHAIAPSYLPVRAGLAERLHWRLEQAIKAAENRAGGPISVHGATVFYRRTTLLSVLERLDGRDWLNDDLVIPSMLRLADPAREIVYLRPRPPALAYVLDEGLKPDVTVEYRRRRRMMHGSAEWLQLMLAQRCGGSAMIALLVSRRVCRMLWGYWVVCLALAGLLLASRMPGITALHYVATAGILSCAFILSNFLRRLATAFLAALRTPFWLFAREPHATSWQ